MWMLGMSCTAGFVSTRAGNAAQLINNAGSTAKLMGGASGGSGRLGNIIDGVKTKYRDAKQDLESRY